MQIEHLAILAFIIWMIIAVTFVVVCIVSDNKAKKQIRDQVHKNKTVFFVEHNPLQWEDLDFSDEQYPVIKMH